MLVLATAGVATLLSRSDPAGAGPTPSYLSDLAWASATNGWGPVERDMSVGGSGAGDGRPITLNGVVFPKGLGAHASSTITYALNGSQAFAADVGVDDECGNTGSVVFQVFVNGVKRFDSGTMTGATATKPVLVNTAGATQLRLVVTSAGDGKACDHADWAGARLTGTPPPTSSTTTTTTTTTTAPPNGTIYVSDLAWVSATNGWGPVERDMSVGGSGAGDGRPITLNGVVFPKGLGAHASSTITYALNGSQAFAADVGVDDECGNTGSVVFQVFVNGVKRFDSGTMTGATATKPVLVNTAGATQLRLVVTSAGDGKACDHADWAGARLTGTGTPPPTLPPPPPDQGPPANSPAIATDTGFVTGLTNPWDMSFLGDGTMFFTERPGPIKVRLTSGTINTIVTPSNVAPAGEAGMMGIAVDPNFATNHFLYACYTASTDNRVARWEVNATLNGVVNTTPTVLVTGLAKANFHDGCRVRFGPDGKLWVTTGDGGVGTLPQNLNSLNGKVLRLNPDGSAPADNPFFGATPGNDLIFSYGHRNPQGISFRPSTGVAYASEHGPDKNDEVNRLVAGGNGGWDPIPGYNQAVPMTDLAKYPGAMIPAWRSGDGGTVAPSGATFLSGGQWKAWDGALAVAFLKNSRVRVMFLDGDGDVSFSTVILANGVRLRSVVQGPDGNLYVATDVGSGNGAIWKVTPT